MVKILVVEDDGSLKSLVCRTTAISRVAVRTRRKLLTRWIGSRLIWLSRM